MFIKYPRTPHLPWSPGATRDDRVLENTTHFEDKTVVATVKLDGENTTLYSTHLHARSLDSKDHPSRHWIKSLHNRIKHEIPDDWRICGENLYAKHTIHYEDLPDYFMVFSVWDEYNECLNWSDTAIFCDALDLCVVPTIFFGKWSNAKTMEEEFDKLLPKGQEGYVVRLFGEFGFDEFDTSIAKYVRKGHVQTGNHWMYQEVIPNKLKRKEIE